ncbi:MAG: DUF1311 domain-containing protein, partial [Hyphomicrobiales bacterium]|nr:DUF1311 domain-containing protein [Hyphomicrobiales bacterium]
MGSYGAGGIRPFKHGVAKMGFAPRLAFILMGFSLASTCPHSVYAASFDCSEAKTHIEIAICGDAALSELDSLLAAELKAAFVRHRDQRQDLLSKQRAWLHARDQKCSAVDSTPDVSTRVEDCLRLLYADRIAVLTRDRPDNVGSFEGRWSETYPCNLDKEECGGRSDMFSLDLWSSGARLCGSHIATAHLGNRVDENDSMFPS